MTKTPSAHVCMQRATISRYHLCSQQLSISGNCLLYLVYSVTGIPGMAYAPDLILLSCPAWVIQFQSYLLSVSIRGAFQPVGILLWRDNRHTPLCHNLSLCSMITKGVRFVKGFPQVLRLSLLPLLLLLHILLVAPACKTSRSRSSEAIDFCGFHFLMLLLLTFSDQFLM